MPRVTQQVRDRVGVCTQTSSRWAPNRQGPCRRCVCAVCQACSSSRLGVAWKAGRCPCRGDTGLGPSPRSQRDANQVRPSSSLGLSKPSTWALLGPPQRRGTHYLTLQAVEPAAPELASRRSPPSPGPGAGRVVSGVCGEWGSRASIRRVGNRT